MVSIELVCGVRDYRHLLLVLLSCAFILHVTTIPECVEKRNLPIFDDLPPQPWKKRHAVGYWLLVGLCGRATGNPVA